MNIVSPMARTLVTAALTAEHWNKLADKIERAPSGRRILDLELELYTSGAVPIEEIDPHHGGFGWEKPRAFTAPDVGIAHVSKLVRETLPGWSWRADSAGAAHLCLYDPLGERDTTHFFVAAATVELAACAVYCRVRGSLV